MWAWPWLRWNIRLKLWFGFSSPVTVIIKKAVQTFVILQSELPAGQQQWCTCVQVSTWAPGGQPVQADGQQQAGGDGVNTKGQQVGEESQHGHTRRRSRRTRWGTVGGRRRRGKRGEGGHGFTRMDRWSDGGRRGICRRDKEASSVHSLRVR